MSHDSAQPPLSGTLIVHALAGGWAWAELEDGGFLDWPLASLPRAVREGDVVRLHVKGAIWRPR